MPTFCELFETDWRRLRDQLSYMHSAGFVFRGHADARWGIESSLERALKEAKYPPEHFVGLENRAIFEFRRRAHHYVTMPPRGNDTLEWLALLRHHGGPTRLVDVTRSPYVAAFFAFEQSASDMSAIWALNDAYLNTRSTMEMTKHRLYREGDIAAEAAFTAKVVESRIRGVVRADPGRVNERMAAQQGLFFLQLDLQTGFMDNLAAACGLASMTEPTRFEKGDTIPFSDGVPAVIKYVMPNSLRHDAMKDLRFMNITAATVYPGLDGFARSLHTRLRLADL